jgi:hypothetical protein
LVVTGGRVKCARPCRTECYDSAVIPKKDRPTPRSTFPRVPLLALGTLAASCAIPIVQTHVSGIDSRAPLASFSIDGTIYHPTICYSGGRESYFGVDLLDDREHVGLRILIDPIDGPRLRFARYDPHWNKLESTALRECHTLRADIRPTAWRVNEIQDYSGEIDASCVGEPGLNLEAKIRFDHCH